MGNPMKKFIIGVLTIATLTASISSFAWGRWGHHPYYGYRSSGWVAPLVVGGVIGAAAYGAYAQPPVYIQPQPVIIQQQPTPLQSYAPPPPPQGDVQIQGGPVDAPQTHYYCKQSNQYYPQAQLCPSGWQVLN